MADPTVTMLREAATHRGYRLVASRKRTPGTGDYGKFGLTDPKGKPVLGIGDDGLTASAAEIEAYLRGGEIETWKKSARLAPSAPPAKKRAIPPPDAAPPPMPRRKSAARTTAPPSDGADRKAAARAAAKSRPEPKPNPRPEPAPLRVRKAEARDADGIAKLLASGRRSAAPAATIAERIARIAKAGGLLVAEQGSLIGCLAWTLAPALHRPLSGRIATLVVAEKQRRTGVGKALVEEAARQLAKAGCASIEAMSDIDIRSAHGFFRKLRFEETSYRFAKTIAAER